jgi:hypothetical protein
VYAFNEYYNFFAFINVNFFESMDELFCGAKLEEKKFEKIEIKDVGEITFCNFLKKLVIVTVYFFIALPLLSILCFFLPPVPVIIINCMNGHKEYKSVKFII